MMSDKYLAIQHLINDLVEDVFFAKGMTVHVRAKQDDPLYGNVEFDECDDEIVRRIDMITKQIQGQIILLEREAHYSAVVNWQADLRELLGIEDKEDE